MESKTIYIFKEISKIPRESGNEGKIAEYLCEFARDRNLYYIKDDFNNVYIRKENGTNEFIILQAHTDMVCEKELNKEFDFEKDSIEVIEENGFLKANGTTLGADDGIGVAQILALLDSDKGYNIEALFTTSEETSMVGAINFDTSILKGRKLLNLDGFNENSILIESAAFYDIQFHDNFSFENVQEKRGYIIELTGLKGGHSGTEINKNNGNASILLCELLKNIEDLKISEFLGGEKFNVIPSNAYALVLSECDVHKVVNEFVNSKKDEFPSLEIKVIETDINKVLSHEDSIDFINAVYEFRHGVFYEHDGFVTSSINLGSVSLKNHLWKVGMRSSRSNEERECLDYLKNFCSNRNIEFELLGHQPGFISDPNSVFIKKILEAHPSDLFKSNPSIERVHVTVEVGFFQEKCPLIEIAIISPNIIGAHTPQECVEIDSINRTDKWISNLLELL